MFSCFICQPIDLPIPRACVYKMMYLSQKCFWWTLAKQTGTIPTIAWFISRWRAIVCKSIAFAHFGPEITLTLWNALLLYLIIMLLGEFIKKYFWSFCNPIICNQFAIFLLIYKVGSISDAKFLQKSLKKLINLLSRTSNICCCI